MENTIKVGDIVEHTGGYNCTQTQFYIVSGFNKSGKKAYIQHAPKSNVSGDWMNGAVAPDPTKKYGEEIHEVMVKTDSARGMYFRGRINTTVKPVEGKHEGWVNHGPVENFYKWNGEPKWNNCD